MSTATSTLPKGKLAAGLAVGSGLLTNPPA